jgi:hypothetical protein
MVLGVLASPACGASPVMSADDGGGLDAEVTAPVDTGPPWVEIGTGDDEFVPLADGDDLLLYRGLQGSQHVFVSVRLGAIDARAAEVAMELYRRADRVPVAAPYSAPLPFTFRDDGVAEVAGIILVVEDPTVAFGRDCVLGVTAEDPEMRSAHASVVVRIEWWGVARKLEGGG